MYKQITADNIRPYFQPIVCVDTRNVFAYEVLGRLVNSTGISSLGSFFHDDTISAAQKVRVDRIIRFKALETLQSTHKGETLFLNIQPQWLIPFIKSKQAYPTMKHIEDSNLKGNQIVIEIMEDEFYEDMDTLLALISRYRKLGCKIAIDDFGEGFSSLERIAFLHPDFLKISTELVERSKKGIGSNVLDALGYLCEKTGASLVLEQVETMEQYLLGLEAGVRYYQGCLFAAAQDQCLEIGIFNELLSEGLNIYMNRKNVKQKKQLQITERMNSYINEVIVGDTVSASVINPDYYITRLILSAHDDWLRAYICNRRGYQVTPNYTKSLDGKWNLQPEFCGRNWCWRPYFLPNVLEADQGGRGILSQEYLDIESHHKVWTFIYPLYNDLFLFIDCQYPFELTSF